MDPTAQNVGIGGALFLGALYLFLKYRPWQGANGPRSNESGSKSVEFWESHISRVVKEAIQDAFVGRNEELRRLMLEVVKTGVRDTMQYFYGYRKSGDD